MKKFLIPVFIFLLSLQSYGEAHPYHFLQMGILPPVSTYSGSSQHNSLALSVLFQDAGRISGLGISPVNRVQGSTSGILLGVVNYLGGPFYGVQFSLASLNQERYGISLGMANLNYGRRSAGIQMGAVNFNAFDFAGLQVGGINGQTSFFGLQIAWFNRSAKVYGWETGIVNITHEMFGFQLGAFNIIQKGRGLQLGIFNWVQTESIIPLGLISIVADQPVYFELQADSGHYINYTLQHGSKWNYNLYGFSKYMSKDHWLLSWGWGFKTRMALMRWHVETRLFIDPQYIATHPHLKWRVNTFIKLQAMERLGVSLGFYYDFFTIFSEDSSVFDYVQGDFVSTGKGGYFHLPGVTMGFQF